MPDALVTVVAVQPHGTAAMTLTYKTADGRVADRLLYRSDEDQLEIVESGRPWTFDGDGELFRLVSEARRIDLAYLFDPYVAVSTALVEPLPHQITAVYEEMLPRQPLRFLLADDPGAGKTIMTGLFIRELLIRGDLRRCLIVAPGSLVEQWQMELGEKFRLPFGILTRSAIDTSKSGNPFNDDDLLIARLDMLSRDEDLQLKLENSHDWDLIVFDEAHKLSATLRQRDPVVEVQVHQLRRPLGQHERRRPVVLGGRSADWWGAGGREHAAQPTQERDRSLSRAMQGAPRRVWRSRPEPFSQSRLVRSSRSNRQVAAHADEPSLSPCASAALARA